MDLDILIRQIVRVCFGVDLGVVKVVDDKGRYRLYTKAYCWSRWREIGSYPDADKAKEVAERFYAALCKRMQPKRKRKVIYIR